LLTEIVAQVGAPLTLAHTSFRDLLIITARVRIIGPVTAIFNEWTCTVHFAGADDCPNVPHFGVINNDLELTQAGGEQFTPSFDKVRGRSVSFSVRFTVEGQTVEDFAFASILGTNTQRSEVQAALPHDTLRRIACRESGQRQFDAPADGGVSFCPLYSSDRRGRVGIMQVPDPTPDHIWNWRENVKKGIAIFNERVAAASEYPSSVRNSEEFKGLVAQFNQRRQQQGLNPIQVVLPPFATGNFDDFNNLQELELDAVRGYNGWAERKGQFGLDLHEFRVAVDRIDGEEVLIVADVNEETLQGKAVWERVPVADRPADIGAPNYVEEVLAFLGGCGSAPTLTCPVVAIVVDPSDTKTHEIRAVVGRTHFVTVKGTGDIVLRAGISPDTPQLRSLLTWEADGADIKQGADRLTAKISRNTPSGARIPVRIKLGSDICAEFLVWIIWCTLTPNTVGTSSMTGRPLGLQGGRGVSQGFPGYFAAAGIDWTAIIYPALIITDNTRRPAIEEQPRVAPPSPPPPGVNLNAGVADSGNLDVTGRGFSGWDMSRQRRQRVFIGNPFKVSPNGDLLEPIEETKANHPVIEDRPMPNYPADEVEGNDDATVGADEDSYPYDAGAGIPGQGTRGTLRSTDTPEVPLLDALDHTGITPGENGDTYRLRNHFREFVRVQLGTTWYRCSDFGLWRWHMNAQLLNGKWNLEPPLIDTLDATNDGFDD
jgi:hypothetical protein